MYDTFHDTDIVRIAVFAADRLNDRQYHLQNCLHNPNKTECISLLGGFRMNVHTLSLNSTSLINGAFFFSLWGGQRSSVSIGRIYFFRSFEEKKVFVRTLTTPNMDKDSQALFFTH